jgi:hypothetical protein
VERGFQANQVAVCLNAKQTACGSRRQAATPPLFAASVSWCETNAFCIALDFDLSLF